MYSRTGLIFLTAFWNNVIIPVREFIIGRKSMSTRNSIVTHFSTTKDLGLCIRNTRTTMNLQQVDAALLCGVGVRFLSDLENGKETVRFGCVLKVIAGLGLTLAIGQKQPFWIKNDRST